MGEFKILALPELNLSDLKRVVSGYSSHSKYMVLHTSKPHSLSFNLQLVPLDKPYIKSFDHFDFEAVERYNIVLSEGYSFGAWDGDLLMGLAIVEPHEWNRSLWVWEFHVMEAYRNRGIGKKLMEMVGENAGRKGFRTIVCETQNTNVAAIHAYEKMGFRMEGIDISYYTNEDYPDGEIAVFMKRRLS